MPLFSIRLEDRRNLAAGFVSLLAIMTAYGILKTARDALSANTHWATDVLTGAGIGLFSGWLMPWLLHFRHDTTKRHDGPMRALRFVSPYGSRHELGLSLAGAF